VRLEGEARRTLAALGIKSDVPKTRPALQQRRRARWGAQASQENKATKKAVQEKPTPSKRLPDDEEETAT